MTEAEVNFALAQFWADNAGVGRAPTVLDLWMEQDRVAELDGQVLPTRQEVLEHFAWFFGGPA